MGVGSIRKSLIDYGVKNLKNLSFKNESGYLKKSEFEFEYYIGFGVAKYSLTYPTEFSFGISSSSINKIYRKIYPDRDYDKKKYTGVFHLRQAVLFEVGKYKKLEYNIENESDIVEMMEEVTAYYKKEFFPFFKSLNTLKKLSGFINYDDFAKKWSPYLANTLISGLILSKLTGDPYYNSLKEDYRELLKDWVEQEKENFEKAIVFLDMHTQDSLEEIVNDEVL